MNIQTIALRSSYFPTGYLLVTLAFPLCLLYALSPISLAFRAFFFWLHDLTLTCQRLPRIMFYILYLGAWQQPLRLPLAGWLAACVD